jgi:hypothetical protein
MDKRLEQTLLLRRYTISCTNGYMKNCATWLVNKKCKLNWVLVAHACILAPWEAEI